MAATSTMHPLAMRSSGAGNGHTSTVQKASQAASQQLRSSTCQAAKESAALTAHIPATRSPRPAHKVSKSHVHGLQHVEDYPSHPANPEIKVLSAAQYHSLQAQESVLETPESILFPWLHGADQRGTQQAYYFGYGTGGLKTPRFRGLTTVTCDNEAMFFRPHSRLNSLASISSYASSASSSSTSSSASSFDSSLDPSLLSGSSSGYGPEARGALLTSAFLPEDLLLKSANPRFSRPAVPFNINLRNFRLQATKLASVSDIIIYSADGLASPDLVPTAERFLAAQKEMRATRLADADTADDLVEYRVFVVEDRFEVFEQCYPDLVAVDMIGFVRNKVDFFDREKEEMRVLTEASPIAEGVWLGNTQDVPIARNGPLDQARVDSSDDLGILVAALETDTLTYNSMPLPKRTKMCSSDSSSSLDRDEMEDGNPHGFSICIEAHDKALMASSEGLKGYENMLDRIHRNVKPGQNVDPAHIVHLECLSTGDACTTQHALDSFVENIVQLVLWIRRQTKRPEPMPASPASIFSRGRKAKSSLGPEDASRSPRNVLIHTTDGYTDTSVLALCYVMYDRGCSLPQAYLHLQQVANRSFFVYPNDVELLTMLETRLLSLAHEERRLVQPVEETSPPPAPALFRSRFSRSNSPSLPMLSRQGSYQQPSISEKMIAAPWFYNMRFDGHFPSRILPHLYLGNLNHATNALMLKELGITHVVSIGESALIPPQDGNESPTATGFGNVPTHLKARLPTNSLWIEQKMGNIEVLDLQGISDDGIDPIKGLFDRSNEFIEDARLKGGKVLVHCRVGVSRSSSLVIAYVMKHCEMDLQSAYLLVRSRRLNILIQPTVLFMWSLQWFEAELNRRRVEAGKRPIGGRLTWGYLSREMCDLNYRYLGC